MPKTRGRPPKQNVERHPGGKIKQPKPVKIESNPDAPAKLNRIREFLLKQAEDPRLDSVVGVAFIQRKITSTECEAALQIAEICGRDSYYLDSPSRSACSPAYELGRATGGRGAEEIIDPKEKKRILEAKSKAREAYRALPMNAKKFSRETRDRLMLFCVDNQPIPSHWYTEIRAALEVHADHLGIGGSGRRKKSKQSSKPMQPKETAPKQSPSIILREREAWMMTLEKIAPNLNPDNALKAFDYFKALAARSEFRKDKANSQFKSRAPQNSFAMA